MPDDATDNSTRTPCLCYQCGHYLLEDTVLMTAACQSTQVHQSGEAL